MKKSQLRKLIRENIHSIMNEQNNTAPPCYYCADNSNTVNSHPAYPGPGGAYFVPNQSGVMVCYTVLGPGQQYNGYQNQSDAQANCSGGSAGCTLSDFENAVAPYNVNPQWTPMFYNKFSNHSNGCQFLSNRLMVISNKLSQLVNAGTNPQWQVKLGQKISAIQAIIAQCCPQGAGS
tara:strand:- start:21 stop:551 length:531 start_codon:yes stop_codon:yes gene_type:complete